MPELNSNGAPVEVGGITLRTPGLTGTATSTQSVDPAVRGAAELTPELDEALRNEGMEAEYTVEISDTREVPAPTGETRSTSYDEPAMEVEVPAAGEGWGQIVLAVDESGVVTWNFPVSSTAGGDLTRGGSGGTDTFVIRRYVPDETAEPGDRGPIGTLGRKVLKVLVYPLVEDIAGEIGDAFAKRWETKNRPYQIRAFGPDDYRLAEAAPAEGAAWERLGAGRALLLLHGTFSRAHNGFGGFSPEDFENLYRRYEGRVFALDHFTLSEDPRQNVEWFLRQMPDDARLDLDVLCHSRGGLVGRVLAERQSEMSLGSRSLRVEKVVFAATPNNGTVLANPEHFGTLIDSMTNLLLFVPDNGVTEVLETVITAAKHIAVGAFKGLEGLMAMTPDGEFLTSLNASPKGDTNYFALAANFEPTNHGWKVFAKDRLMDAIFKDTENDLVVPTGGVHEANTSANFPIANPLLFAATDGISHSDFFRHRKAVDQILTWLQP